MIYFSVLTADCLSGFISSVVSDIGELESIDVIERGEGGNIMSLLVVGQKETILVETEYMIRTLLAPNKLDSSLGTIEIVRETADNVSNMSLLPSAFFVSDTTFLKDGTIGEFTIYGGGYGHGVGMSQEGVRGMVSRGYTYEEIIEHYYNCVEIASYL
ncbi:MAG: hypothetical protein ATN35_00415 [Epulopiscium sp. Nele67-Bin004]|nr:MAG: hypothetical protein ATN35_00415 [Epulopiscium sp. Nele67-Bin004]